MTHDSEYCRRRAAEALATASHKGESEEMRIAGDLARAYATLAQRRMVETAAAENAAEPQIAIQTAIQD